MTKKHRTFSPEFKAQAVLTVISGNKTAAEICREHQIKPDLFSKWKAAFLDNAAKVFERETTVDPQQARIAELEHLVGRLDARTGRGKKASTLLRPPASRRRPVIDQLVREGYAVIVVCEVLYYPRSTYYHTATACDQMTRCGTAIRDVVGEWPRYGYRRVTAELRRREPAGESQAGATLDAVDEFAAEKQGAKKRRTTNSQHAFPRYPNLVPDLSDHPPGSGLGLRHHLDRFAARMRLSGRDHGCLHPQHSRLVIEPQPGAHFDAGAHCRRPCKPTAGNSLTPIKACSMPPPPTRLKLQAHGVQISMAEVGEPTQNGYAERLMRTIKEEEVDLSDYDDYHDA